MNTCPVLCSLVHVYPDLLKMLFIREIKGQNWATCAIFVSSMWSCTARDPYLMDGWMDGWMGKLMK